MTFADNLVPVSYTHLDVYKRQGLRRARLGFAKGNCQSEAFWTKNGFVRTGEEVNNGSYTAVVMERVL